MCASGGVTVRVPLRCEVVEPHRTYPPDEPNGQWYEPERGYQEPEWDRQPPGSDIRQNPDTGQWERRNPNGRWAPIPPGQMP